MTLRKETQVYLTCYHVWREFEALRSEHDDAFLVGFIDNRFVSFEGYKCIDHSRQLDLAILHSYEKPQPLALDQSQVRESFFTEQPEIVVPDLGEMAYVLGYPRVARSIDEKGMISMDSLFLAFAVTSTSPTRSILSPHPNTTRFYGKASIQPDSMIGGMSGSPAFLFRKETARPLLFGMFTDGDTPLSPMFISHLNFLRPDGTLDHLGLPPDWGGEYKMPAP